MDKVSKQAKEKSVKEIIDWVEKMPDTFDSNKKKLNDIERKILRLD